MFQQSLQTNEVLKKLLREQGQSQLIEKLVKQLQIEEMAQEELSSLFKETKSFPERSMIFRLGDQASFAYYLLSGRVDIRYYDSERRVKSRNVINPGQFFGEVDVIQDNNRSGNAVALVDSQILIIENEKFRQAYQKNKALASLIDASIHLYQIPVLGLVTQYQERFLGHPAVNTIIQKQDGEVIKATRLINAEVFAISCVSDSGLARKEIFSQSEGYTREIMLLNNRLVGAISIGPWDDLEDIVKKVNDKVVISQNELENFRHVGKINIGARASRIRSNVLCECMQVPYQRIQEIISQGVITEEEISKRTAAGTVCGGCRPRIIDLLGGEAWMYVNITAITEHSPQIRSYQFRPIRGAVSPYKAGQHIVIEANIENLWIARSYTLTSIDNADYYEITVRHEPAGIFSTWLFEQGRVGAQLRISAPQGQFVFDEEKEIPAICFMAGIGVTPAISFVRRLVHSPHKRILYIDYSIRQADQAIFCDELSQSVKGQPSIYLCTRITSQESRLNEKDVVDLIRQYPESEIFICGPKNYEKNIVEVLSRFGVPNNNIYLENFTHASGNEFKY